MSFSKQLSMSYYEPYNLANNQQTQYNFGDTIYQEASHEKIQEHKKFPADRAQWGTKYVFNEDSLSKLFFSEENMTRIQKKIKDTVYEQTKHQYKLEEDQDESDLLVAMRAVFMKYGKFRDDKIIHQVKVLNNILVNSIMPDMISMIKQEYAYIKEINEPIKPITRPINVSRAGRRTLPSITTTWF